MREWDFSHASAGRWLPDMHRSTFAIVLFRLDSRLSNQSCDRSLWSRIQSVHLLPLKIPFFYSQEDHRINVAVIEKVKSFKR